jgi:ABC-type multidrug transport system ATPase subunit
MIKFDKVSKKYGINILYEHFTYEFAKSNIYVITGESGSGKTSILDILYKITKPSRGSIIYENTISSYNAVSSFFLDEYSVFENLFYILKIRNQEKNISLVEEYLEFLNINGCKHKNIKNLSAGQKRRVGIIATLSLDSDYYILDEPYADLDKSNRDKVTRLIKRKRDEGKTVVITSHQNDLLDDCSFVKFQVSDKINILNYDASDRIIIPEKKIVQEKYILNSLVRVKIGIRHFIIALMISILSLTLLLFNQQYLNNKSDIDGNIYVLENTNSSLIDYYDNIFDYIEGDMVYEALNYNAVSSVIALPVSLYNENYMLKENEVIVSSLVYEKYKDKSFESLGLDGSNHLIGKYIIFKDNRYIVKEVLDLMTNVIYLSDEKMRSSQFIVSGKNQTLEFIQVETILKEGLIPKDNNKYIEIISNMDFHIGDIIDNVYIVSGISVDNKFYMRKDDFKKHYLQAVPGKKIIYTSENNDIENILKVLSISFTNLKEEADKTIELNQSMQLESNQVIIKTLFYAIIFVVISVTVVDFLFIKNKINLHRFMKVNFFKMMFSLLLNIFVKYITILVFSIIFIYLSSNVLIFIFNLQNFTIKLDRLLNYGLICFIISIVAMLTSFLVNKIVNKLHIHIRENKPVENR